MPGKQLVWDALGRLVQVKDGTGTVIATYTYDALDRLRTATSAGATTRFRYVGQTNAVAQDVNDATGAIVWNHATDLAGTDLLDFSSDGSTVRYLGRNAHGDVTWTAGSIGAVSATLLYDPFGNTVNTTGSSLPANRWQGSWLDVSTGLYYVIARWYAPSLGAFASEDPLTHPATEPQDRDLYAYGSGDPVDRVDANGSTWSRSATVAWARQFANRKWPSHVREQGASGDCTNHVSWSLLRGGYPMMVPPVLRQAATSKSHTARLATIMGTEKVKGKTLRFLDRDAYWFNLKDEYGTWHMSYTWTTPKGLFNWFVGWGHGVVRGQRKYKPGPGMSAKYNGARGEYITWTLPPGVKPGDIAFAQWNNGWERGITHAMVVTQVGPSNQVYFAQHTPGLAHRSLYNVFLSHHGAQIWFVAPSGR
jgi:RHS repeat-associated protein